jgi:hypothetical protein
MGLLEKMLLAVEFPKLTTDTFEFTSPKDREYNCIAWAAGESDRWWWPDHAKSGYWPKTVAREETLDAFIAAYATLGYQCCPSGEMEQGFEKIVILATPSGKPAHAARQLEDGTWTSKLGQSEDICHHDADGIENETYGRVVQFMKRVRA